MSIEIDRPAEFVLRYSKGRCEPPDPLSGPDGEMLYPDRDGRPMSDNTLQADWIAVIKGGLDRLYRDDPDVFLAADLMWYPVEGRNRRRLAPDVMAIFDRPKGYRGSYQQFKEEDVPPTVVFEIWSPGNRRRVMDYKFRIYEMYGVQEYYHYEPYKIRLDGWVRDGDALRPIPQTNGWVSPRLGIRFEVGDDLTIVGPDGRPFQSVIEASRELEETERIARTERERADAEAEVARLAVERADDAARRADAEARFARMEGMRADAEAGRADLEARNARVQAGRADAEAQGRRAESERADAEAQGRRAESERADRLAAQLRALGMEPEA